LASHEKLHFLVHLNPSRAWIIDVFLTLESFRCNYNPMSHKGR
jgi:hypothetical protein